MIEIFEDRFNEEAGVSENPLLLKPALASPPALPEAHVEPPVGLEHVRGPADKKSKTFQRVRRIHEYSTVATVHGFGNRLPQVVVHGVVLPAVLLSGAA